MVSKVLASEEKDGKVVITPRNRKGKSFSEMFSLQEIILLAIRQCVHEF